MINGKNMTQSGKKKILVVNDKEKNGLIKLICSEYEVIFSYCGQEALEKAKVDMPDLILLAVDLPNMDGYEVCKILTTSEETRFIPVILTGVSYHSKDILRLEEAGAAEIICGDFISRGELLTRISSVLYVRSLKGMGELRKINKSNRNRILIVDDEPDVLDWLELILMYDYEIIRAYFGQEALDKAISEKPSLIILDIMMPDMNGYEVCRILKNDERTKTIPIIMLTSLCGYDDLLRGLECGANDYLRKPPLHDELLMRVKSFTKLVTDVKRDATIIYKKVRDTKIEPVVDSVWNKLEKWEIGDQDEMEKNIDDLIFYLRRHIPDVPENKEIFSRINNVKKYRKVEYQISAITLIISCLPSVVIHDDILDIKTKIDTTLENTQKIIGTIELLKISLGPSLKEEIQVTAGFSHFGTGVQYVITIPIKEIAYTDVERALLKRVGSTSNNKKLPVNFRERIKKYVEQYLEEKIDK